MGTAMQRQRLRYRYRKSQWTPCGEVRRKVGRQTEEAQEAEVEEDHLNRRDRHHRRVSLQVLQQREPLVLVHTCIEWIRSYLGDQ